MERAGRACSGTFAYSTSSSSVYQFPNGTQVSICTFEDISVYPDIAQVLRDFACTTYLGQATVTSAMLTPTGHLTFTCSYLR